jgi:phosphatidylcholine synthase
VSAWLAHLYTATGAVIALLAMGAVIDNDYRRAFFWLTLQVAVDATDGLLARRVRVHERLPWFNGSKLDDIIDYLTYVFIPAVIVWHAPLVPPDYATLVPGAVLVSSAYGFCREDAKTSDHFFTGFPSYWNIVVFYLLVAGTSPAVNMAVLLVLALLVFVPIRYVYPSRTPILMVPTNVLAAVWGIVLVTMMWMFPSVPPALFAASFVFPVYYVVLSLVLHVQHGRERPS